MAQRGERASYVAARSNAKYGIGDGVVTLAENALITLRTYLRKTDATSAELAERLRAGGWPDVTATDVRLFLAAHPADASARGELWHLLCDTDAPAVKLPDQRRPIHTYEQAPWRFNTQILAAGVQPPDDLGVWEARFAATIDSTLWARLRVRAHEADVRVDKVIAGDEPWFVAWQPASAKDRSMLAAADWHLWRRTMPINWSHPTGYLRPQEIHLAVPALATWRAQSGSLASAGVCTWLFDYLRIPSAADLTLSITQPPNRDVDELLATPLLQRIHLQRPAGPNGFVTCDGCHRPLTDPLSVERGVGPECWHRRRGGSFVGFDTPHPTKRAFWVGAHDLEDWNRQVQAHPQVAGA